MVRHAGAEDDVRAAPRERLREARKLGGQVLAVAVHEDDGVVAQLEGAAKPGRHRGALALVVFVHDDLRRAGLARLVGGAVGRAVVDHDRVEPGLARAAHDSSDVALLAAEGDQGGETRLGGCDGRIGRGGFGIGHGAGN